MLSLRTMRTRNRPETASPGTVTVKAGVQAQLTRPVVLSSGHPGWLPTCAVPLASARAPAPPYQPMR